MHLPCVPTRTDDSSIAQASHEWVGRPNCVCWTESAAQPEFGRPEIGDELTKEGSTIKYKESLMRLPLYHHNILTLLQQISFYNNSYLPINLQDEVRN